MKKKKLNKKVIAVSAIALAVLALIAGAIALFQPRNPANKPTGPNTFTGYLICQDCGLKGKCSMNNIDLTTHPEKHLLKCSKMPDCVASGYGIAVQQSNGKYKYYCFDSNGSILALDGIIFKTKLADNLLVQVRGTLNSSNDKINVESVQEISPETTAPSSNTKPPANSPVNTKLPSDNPANTKPAATKR